VRPEALQVDIREAVSLLDDTRIGDPKPETELAQLFPIAERLDVLCSPDRS